MVFLVTACQNVSVLLVNCKGKPFNHGLLENNWLLWSMSICGIGSFICATNLFPTLNKWSDPSAGGAPVLAVVIVSPPASFPEHRLQLVEYPSEAFGQTIVFVSLGLLMIADFVPVL